MKVHFQKLTYRLDGEKGQDMNAIIGMENAGFTIIDAKNTHSNYGYAIGRNDYEYVTWMYLNRNDRTVSFNQGHYFARNPDAPARTEAEAYADYYRRLADTYDSIAKYGY